MGYSAQSDFPREEFHQSINPHQAEFDRLVAQSLIRRIGDGPGRRREAADSESDESSRIALKERA